MKIFTPFFLLGMVCLSVVLLRPAAAQTIKKDEIIHNQWAARPFSIDAQLNDWSDSLSFYNDDTRFAFDISNNSETIFIAVKSTDKQNLGRIFSRGISFSFNTEGKKKNGPTIVFPIIDRSSQALKPAKAPTPAQVKEIQKKMLADIKRINVFGFPDIRDGAISINNNYGVSAAAFLDAQDNLIIELAVPIRLLNITDPQQPLFCLFEINGIKAPRASYDPNQDYRSSRYGYPQRGYGYERMPRYSKSNEPTGFWIKSILAKNLNN
ncbi:hypothetical protein GZH53_13135 [Flavihumibacter sp. R14]|nr:hypothetical protein [Flavihumibacter soli]